MEPTKKGLELLESQGIISKQTYPIDQCAPIMVACQEELKMHSAVC